VLFASSLGFAVSVTFSLCCFHVQVIRVVLDSTVKVKSVTALYSYGDGFVSGHKDGTIKLWSNSYECKDTFDLNTAKPASMNSGVRSVCVKHDASVVLIGTQGCEIYELAMASKRFTQRVEGHYEYELWGLATHPSAPNLAVTTGDDKTIRLWDLSRHQMIRKVTVDAMARCVVCLFFRLVRGPLQTLFWCFLIGQGGGVVARWHVAWRGIRRSCRG
jgi:WD40 repeat protein